MARRQFSRSTFDSINVTPLIDTLFFLLIIFMITAPLLEYSINVSPPSMNAEKINADTQSKTINVRSDGEILLNHQVITMDELIQILNGYKNEDSETKVFLRADRNVSWGRVVQILKSVKSAGFPNIFLVTTEETFQ